MDDPILATKGSRSRRNRLAVRFCTGLLLLGFGVAFDKAKFHSTVVWIGVLYNISPRTVTVTIPEEKLQELIAIINRMLSRNVVPEKELRSFAGKAMNVATLIVVWRPFLAFIWAALSSSATRAPKNCIWTRQFRLSLLWLSEFLNGTAGTITRTYEYDQYYGSPAAVVITTDASPHGIGGFLTIQGKIVDYFSGEITDRDCEVLQRQRGSHEGQQAFESLAILVAVRLWHPTVRRHRATLSVRTDNMGALSVVAALKGKGPSLGVVARELALELGNCEFFPRTVTHLPGVANVLADSLSRRLDPSKQPWSVPHHVQHILSPSTLPPRDWGWWRVCSREYTYSTGYANLDI